ncbi:hypothetical protein GIB67_035237 [Kingdonia uniflora]|uniref:4-coumarate--CoA ligase n=1 Tax=Kingdonia uniflora TaxID=39325 RepID=A0A7J7KXT1_9MAGN|nr:hypothetical protein GIB67_035237 [Kingdonia uniflora]
MFGLQYYIFSHTGLLLCLSGSYLEWLLAVAFVGGIPAPLNYRWSFEEVQTALEVLRPVMFVFDESCDIWYSALQKNSLSSVRWNVYLGDSPSPVSQIGNALTTEILKKKTSGVFPIFDYRWAPEGIALICFTSGTTGKPKGVTITHTALIIQSLAKIAIVGYNADDIYLHTAPLCHIGGISSGMAMLMVGACHVFVPKFEVKSVADVVEQHQVSSLITVPTMMADLISFIRNHKTVRVGESLTKILNGGGTLSIELCRDASRVFHNAKLLSAYGMTETCSSLTFMTFYEPKNEKSAEPLQMNVEVSSDSINQMGSVCVGKPAPHVELRISSEGSSPIGRILTRGPHVMLKYFNPVLVKPTSGSGDHGWLDTGDIGWISDSGDLWLTGRSKDRIKSGGENIYPEEVEAILSKHPGVVRVVVVGIPDARLSEMVICCVQIKEKWTWIDQDWNHLSARMEFLLSTEILQNYCRQKNLTRFKIPKVFLLWRKPFPVTSSGKLRRDEIKREAMSKGQSLSSKL